jgi:sodium transport system permease protein
VTALFAVFKKELVDGLRDRRALFSLLLFPVIGPLFISLALTRTVERAADRPVELAVVGRANAPGLVAHLEAHGVKIQEAPGDPPAAVRSRRVAMVLVVPDDYASRWDRGKPAHVELLVDGSRATELASVQRVKALLEAHGSAVGTLRLLARGVDPELARPVVVDEIDLATAREHAAIFLNLIPMFVLLAAFLGGMYVATDMTAGERERGSLEPLLGTPASRRSLVLGKWLTAVAFSAFTVTVTLAGVLYALAHVPLDRFGLDARLAARDILALLVGILPLSLFVAATQILVGSFARSFKEAQTYLSFMVLLPTVPAVLFVFEPLDHAPWMTGIPILGQQLLMTDVIRGTPLPPASFLLAALGAIVGTLACLAAATALFRRERIVLAR